MPEYKKNYVPTLEYKSNSTFQRLSIKVAQHSNTSVHEEFSEYKNYLTFQCSNTRVNFVFRYLSTKSARSVFQCSNKRAARHSSVRIQKQFVILVSEYKSNSTFQCPTTRVRATQRSNTWVHEEFNEYKNNSVFQCLNTAVNPML